MQPRYPIYIVSKGRWELLPTVNALNEMGVPFTIIVEAAEYDRYAAVVPPSCLLVLDPEYQAVYDTCDDLGDSKPIGSGPARNFAWEHAKGQGHEWYWCVDDNIQHFYRYQDNRQIPAGDGTLFRTCEDFVEWYENVGMAGPHYDKFLPRKARTRKPFLINRRIYSCNLIHTALPMRWRGRYNEDTILSLDILKAGWCTILFRHFLQGKITTQTMKGGNTDTLYVEGTLPKSQMLARVHPDVARVKWKFGRWHHDVNYKAFARKPRLKRKKGLEVSKGSNNYGMKLIEVGERGSRKRGKRRSKQK